MMDEEYAKIMDEFNALYYTEANLDRKQRELADWEKSLAAEEKELCAKEEQLLVKREKLLERMTDTERRWERLKTELDELLYGGSGIVTQLHDGYSGPFRANERIKALCGEASKLISEQGYADPLQFNFFVQLIWELSVRLDERTESWLSDFLDELTDLILIPEE